MRARRLFTPHGHADDEVLYRLMLAEAETVTGCDGTYYYRINHRPFTFDRVFGQTRANIRSAQLAESRLGAEFKYANAARDIISRNLVGLMVRATRGEGDINEVWRLYAESGTLQSSGGLKSKLLNLALAVASTCHRTFRLQRT
jgi:hypothetical protein